MTTHGPGPPADVRRAAVLRLDEALSEQARLGDDLQLSVTTSAEQPSYARLQAASRHVSECDQAVKALWEEPPMTTEAFSVDGGPSGPGEARTELGERFGAKLDPEVVGVAQLLLSELVTNCVLHGAAGRPGVRVDVRASIFPEALRVEVSDGGAAFRHEAGLSAPDLEGGRGLWLVAEMSSQWGLSDHGPARVWFEIAR